MILPFLLAATSFINPDFEKGLEGWKTSGDVKVETSTPLMGKSSLRLGSGKAAVEQRYDVPGLRILYAGAWLKGSGGEASVRVRCFDRRNRVVLDLRSAVDPKQASGPKGAYASLYFKTQAFTSYVVVSLEKSGAGSFLADGLDWKDDDRDRVEHAPQVDLDAYMRPLWREKTVLDETVLLLSTQGGAPQGNLLFSPAKILSVKDVLSGKEFREGKDFLMTGKTMTVAGSAIPTLSDRAIPKENYPWLDLTPQHLRVTYTHEDVWSGPIPEYQGDRLPRTMAKLRRKKPLTVVAYGDSITLGINVSGFRNVPPYMPCWASLFADRLGKTFGDSKVKLYNTGLGGMLSAWAKENAQGVVASLNPDLVLIGFGMNDFWSVSPEEFRENISATMAAIWAKRPGAEFILIGSMKFDPAYTAEAIYVDHLADYGKELAKLRGPGVAFFDMTELSDALYKAKGAKGLGADPMHPDDFLARWYAQGLITLFEK